LLQKYNILITQFLEKKLLFMKDLSEKYFNTENVGISLIIYFVIFYKD